MSQNNTQVTTTGPHSGLDIVTQMNQALDTIQTNSSGPSDPGAIGAGKFWLDTTNNVIWIRNVANTGWLLYHGVQAAKTLNRSSNTALSVANYGQTINATGTFTQTFNAAAMLTDGWQATIKNTGVGIVTLDPNGTEPINGALTLALNPGDSVVVKCDGTQFITIGAQLAVQSNTNPGFLTSLLYPSQDGKWRDIYRAGWLPNINQQWGGIWYGQIFDCATGLIKDVEVLAGNVQDDSNNAVGSSNSAFYRSTAFKIAKGVTNPQIALKISKAANPTDNITVGIYSDNAGVPNALIGGAATLSGKLITAKADGEDYIFSPTPGALTAGTQYHIVIGRSGASDATNYFIWKYTANSKLPYSPACTGTNVPAWTPNAGLAGCFKVLAPAANQILQSSGRFDQKLVFSGAGSPISQTDYLWQPLKNFWDGKQFTSLVRVSTPNASQPIKDFQLGVDHDRILVSLNASGFAQLDVWDSGGTKRTVTGAASLTTGDHDIGVSIRALGDGADYIRLFVDGVSVGTPLTALTLNFDPSFRESGNATLGGALAFAVPAWTQSMTFGSLPSAQGWTWTGTATEANAMSVSGNKLFQNANGYTSTQSGNYVKASAGLSNANGWTVSAKVRVPSSTNLNSTPPAAILIMDGVKQFFIDIHEYFTQVGGTGVVDFTFQDDFKTRERVITVSGKGSDYYVYLDGRMIVDGTGKLTNASASNQIAFGDLDVTAGSNADAVWSYLKYYTGAAVLPQFTSASISENLEFSGNRESMLNSLWNSGVPVSGKSYMGIGKNYVGEAAIQVESRRDITGVVNTTSTADVVCPEMEGFVLGSDINIAANNLVQNSTALSGVRSNLYLDGVNIANSTFISSTANANNTIPTTNRKRQLLSLHKADIRWSVNANTGTSSVRIFNVEARP